MYRATCDPYAFDTVPRGRWSRFPWSTDGMQSAENTANSRWTASREVVPLLWQHFQDANEDYDYPIALVELGSLKRYTGNASCPPHVDDPQPLSRGRLLSLSVVTYASPDLAGGALVIDTPTATHRVELAAGDLVVFPSQAPHWVEPVTRGARVAFVARAVTADAFAAKQWLWHSDGTPARRCPGPSGRELREYQRAVSSRRRQPATRAAHQKR